MKIFVFVKPNSKSGGVEKIDEMHFIVRMNVPAKEGKANKRIIELLADYFMVSKSRIMLVSGHVSKEKVFEV